MDVWRLGLQTFRHFFQEYQFSQTITKTISLGKRKMVLSVIITITYTYFLLPWRIYYEYSVELLATLTHFMWTGTLWPAGRWNKAQMSVLAFLGYLGHLGQSPDSCFTFCLSGSGGPLLPRCVKNSIAFFVSWTSGSWEAKAKTAIWASSQISQISWKS